jgi:hypothetical protein
VSSAGSVQVSTANRTVAWDDDVPPYRWAPEVVTSVRRMPGSASTSEFSFTAEVWEYDGPTAWFFVSLPEPEADDIEEMFGHRAKGFGSLKVEVTIGATRWSTSIFPDNKRGTYMLPVKKAVRAAENLDAGSRVQVELVVLD